MASIRIGNAPCSWGSLEFEGLGANPLTYDRMLDELVETGYRGAELGDWGFMPVDPDVLRAELHQRGVTMLGAFVPVALTDEAAHPGGVESAVRVARLLAAVQGAAGDSHPPFLVLADNNGAVPQRTQNAGRITPAMGLSEAEWTMFARGAERVAHAVRQQTGLRTVFHHHCAGYVETPDEIAELLRRTDPDLLGLVFDTGHFVYGAGPAPGVSVLEGLNRFAERIWYVHFKDCSPAVAAAAREQRWDYFQAVARGVFCELGQGSVDFAQVKQWMEGRSYDGWLTVEQDILPGMGSPKESARRNREYLRGIGL